MNFLLWLIVGGLVGWLASILMRTNGQQGLFLNIIVGVVGSFVAGYFLSPIFGVSTINQGNYSMPAILLSIGGAAILLAVINLASRGRVR